MSTQADVLIVTVTRVESQAVLAAFEKATGCLPRIETRGDKAFHDLGTVNGARVWMVLSEMGAGGLGASQQAVTKAIGLLHPSAVIMVGIAFGVDEKKQAIGDILVSEKLRLYELQRVGTTKLGDPENVLRGDRPHGSTRLLDAARNAHLHWSGAKVRFGCVLTGEKLVDNVDFRKQLRAFEPEAVGGEMEGAGLYVACHDAKVDWLLVKAICDWADGKKNLDKDPHQALAAGNAAEFVLHTIQTVSLKAPKPKSGSRGRLNAGASASRKAAARPPSDAQLLAAFAGPLCAVAKDCSELVTRGLELGGDTHSKPLLLANVYVALETKTPRPEAVEKRRRKVRSNAPTAVLYSEARKPLSALEVLLEPVSRRVVLVGEPGSGKSTFLQYVTLCLAEQVCGGQGSPAPSAGAAAPPILKDQKAIPLRVLLRDFAQSLDPASPPDSGAVEAYLGKNLKNGSHNEAVDLLPEVLRRGLAFVLFDGLDEVPRARLADVKAAIVAFSTGAYSACRIAVTCRTESYRKPEFQLQGFPPPHEVAPLSSDMQAKFVDAWYRELGRVQPQFDRDGTACAASLRRALVTERLRDMAGNPFFLTAMAALHRPDRPLPDTSAELMDALVNGVLEESRKRTDADTGQLPELASLLAKVPDGFRVLRLRLEAVAFIAREKRQDHATRLIDKDLLQSRLLLDKRLDGEWLDNLMESLRHRAGLLQSPDGEQYQFAYRFEEFLAGCHLTNRDAWERTEPSFTKRARTLLGKQGDYARQTVIWAAGVYAHVRRERSAVRDLVSALAPVPKGATGKLADLKLAADIACDAGMGHWQDDDVPDVEATVHRLRSRLEEVSADGSKHSIADRAQAASAIGRLGDSRPGVGLKDGLPDIDFGTEPLPAGKLTLGEHGKVGQITQGYRISRYPVTVAQFDAFVNEKGYDLTNAATQRWWCKAGLAWLRKSGVTGPETHAPVFQTSNHPQVGVSGYEASAFCAWLTERLRAKGRLKADETIRLPHEAEWEQAARWNVELRKADDRDFPWGRASEDSDLATRCNMRETGIDSTSAVGLFPKGASGCGAMDMAGNVWEWCKNKKNEKVTARVLRGGSWNFGIAETLPCLARAFTLLGNRIAFIGFRCVLVGSARG